jgi:hypothetical protein
MKKLIQFVLLLVLVSATGYAQDESSIKPYLNSGDLAKLGKADKIKADADRQMEEVRSMNVRIQSLQKDSTLNARNKKKQVSLLQSQSWKKHVQASAAYEKSNDIKYGIYKKYLNHFWKEHEGQEANYINAKMLEEQARDNFAQASVYRRNTRHMNLGSVKVEKLAEANNLEAAAIRRQVSSLASCFGAGATVAATIPADSISHNNVPETKSQPTVTETPPVTVAAPVTVAPPVTFAAPVVVAPAVIPEEKTGPVPAEKISSFDNQVLFRIQIAANKAPFTFADLKKICPGNYPVEIVSEAGWYKYQFIGVPLFSDASRILKEAAVTGAFVVAYQKTTKLNISEAAKANREFEKRLQAEGRSNLIGEIQYHIVLTSSKTFLNPGDVSKLYKGPEPVLVIMENGVYAYHLMAGYSLQDALDLKEKTGLNNAAVVTYKNAKKVVSGGTL